MEFRETAIVKAIIRTAALQFPLVRRMAERLAKHESENRHLAERLAKHESENRHLAEQFAKHESENRHLAERLAKHESENRHLAERLAKHESENRHLAEQFAKHKSENRHLAEQLVKHESYLSALSDKLTGRMTLLSSEIARLLPAKNCATDRAVMYLDLLERSLTGMLFEDPSISPWSSKTYDPETRLIGRDWPALALTMIGLVRLRNLRVLAETVLADGIAGDLLEAGVWRGGACILMRGVLAAHGIIDRKVWVADSFAGLPPPDPETYPADANDEHSTVDALRVSSDVVEANFRRYGLLDSQVRFLKGWFSETLPTAPIDRLAILRLDGDMYSSTIQILDALYAKVSPGGYVIVDDYILAGCRQAVDDFRARHSIGSELVDVDGAAVYWRKT
jgi:O-methyltransferase/8-demethyl-8-(2,3-dimethoxy-alpha-L-rhamnosyl)tetracenomycin-C 4'-O-methyltransferase